MTKGWCSVKPYRCGATHYVEDGNQIRSLCGRAPIRITSAGVMSMTKERQRQFAKIEICNWCEHVRYHHKKVK